MESFWDRQFYGLDARLHMSSISLDVSGTPRSIDGRPLKRGVRLLGVCLSDHLQIQGREGRIEHTHNNKGGSERPAMAGLTSWTLTDCQNNQTQVS